MFDFDALAHAICSRTVLCVGDLMLDEFVYGEVSRISPEAPAPVIAVQRSETNIGGGGKVARHNPPPRARRLFVWLSRDDDAGGGLKSRAFPGRYDRKHIDLRFRTADYAKSAFCFRAFLYSHAARGLGTGRTGAGRDRAKTDRRHFAAIATRGCRVDI